MAAACAIGKQVCNGCLCGLSVGLYSLASLPPVLRLNILLGSFTERRLDTTVIFQSNRSRVNAEMVRTVQANGLIAGETAVCRLRRSPLVTHLAFTLKRRAHEQQQSFTNILTNCVGCITISPSPCSPPCPPFSASGRPFADSVLEHKICSATLSHLLKDIIQQYKLL